MFNLIQHLSKEGHEILIFALGYSDNEDDPQSVYWPNPTINEYNITKTSSLTAKISAGVCGVWNHGNASMLEQLIRDRNPDKALVLQFSMKLSNSILHTLEKHHVPYFIRISDFGYMCINNILQRNGAICEKCNSSALNGILYSCGVGRLKSTILTANNWMFRLVLASSFKGFISPSQSTISRYKKSRLGHHSFYHVPTFQTHGPILENGVQRSSKIAYFGRVSADKGLSTLGSHLKSYSLDLYGPLIDDSILYISKFNYYGSLHRNEVQKAMRQYKIILFNTKWLDNLPNALIEACYAGCLVVAPNKGSFKELLFDQEFAELFDDESEIEVKIDTLLKQSFKDLSSLSRNFAERKFSWSSHRNALKECGFLEF